MFLSGTLNGTKTSSSVHEEKKKEIIIKIGQDEPAINFHDGESLTLYPKRLRSPANDY